MKNTQARAPQTTINPIPSPDSGANWGKKWTKYFGIKKIKEKNRELFVFIILLLFLLNDWMETQSENIVYRLSSQLPHWPTYTIINGDLK